MIEIEPFELLRLLVGIAYAGLQVVVPVWLCVRFRLWGALISVLFLWGLRLAWLRALPAIDPQADTNFSAAVWFVIGLPTCLIIASIIFGLTTIGVAIIRKVRRAPANSHGFRLHRLEVYGLSLVSAAILLIGGLAMIGPGGNTGPVFRTLAFVGKPCKFSGWIENTSPETMNNVVAVCEVVDGHNVLERYSFHRNTLGPYDEWEIETTIRHKGLLTRISDTHTEFTYHTRITAERKRVGPLLFVYRREWHHGANK